MEIVADSTIGAGDFAATTGRATWVQRREGLRSAGDAKALPHGLAEEPRWAMANRARVAERIPVAVRAVLILTTAEWT
jgi:hypothetical protein